VAQTIRVFWADQRTGWKNFNWGGGPITDESVIHISAAEGTSAGDIIRRVRGPAIISVRNVVPHADTGGGSGVEFYLDVAWHTPVDVVLEISVDDPPVSSAIL
jgi:hypothetical protein